MKKKVIVTTIIIILSILINIFMYNNDFLYKTTIMKITSIETIKEDSNYNSLGIEEKYYTKKISGVITNTKDKGKKETVEYEETYSSVTTDKYRVGDKVFIKNGEIDNLKRDFYLSIMITLFIVMIFIVGSIKGLLSVLSLVLNILIFYVGLELYFKGVNLLFICIIEAIIFSILSLIISNGINNKTKAAVISTITSTLLLLIISFMIIKITNYKGITFNELKFLTVPPEDIIIPELLLGALGAIMDVAITISSSISELIEKKKKITNKELITSSKEIGKDIMSTMINVLFFTYLCSGLPTFVLALRNGFTITNYINNNFNLEITRFLVGSIGIVLTIPITLFISIMIFKKESEV